MTRPVPPSPPGPRGVGFLPAAHAEEPMPIGIACPACSSQVGYNGRCTQCGAQAFEPPPWWERVLMVIAVVLIIAVNCAAAPFSLIFALGFGLARLWLSRRRGGRA